MHPIDQLVAAAFDAANDAIALTGSDGRILYANPSFTTLYGYTMAELTNLRMADFRSPAQREELEADLQAAAAAGGLAYETEHRRRDGTTFPVGVSIRAVSLGGRGYWVSILRDISVRKAAEGRAATLRRLYDALLDANRAVVQSADRDTLFARICETCVSFGFRLAWVGLRDGDVVVPVAVAGEDAAYLDGISVSARDGDPMANGPTGTAVRTGCPFICNDFLAEATTAPWHDRARPYGLAASAGFPLFEGGRPVGALTLYAGRAGFFGADEVALIEQFAATVSLALDRLATEHASRHLTDHPIVRTILDAVPTAVLVAHDPGCSLITGNRAAEQMLKRAAGSNLARSSLDGLMPQVREFRHGVELAPHDLPIRRAAGGQVVAEDEVELRFDDGTAMFIQGNAVPLRDASGAVAGAVGVFVDVTQRRLGEEALIAARDIAEKAMAAKARFLAAASHDLRQPLQGLVLMQDVLAARLSSTDAAVLDKARCCTTILCEMVDNLLDLAKLDAGIVVVDKQDCAVEDLLADILPAHAAAAAIQGLTLRHVPSRLVVRTDPALMRRILGNLLANAVKYTRKGGIVIGCRRHGAVARIEVWDSGIGIPADLLDDVFEEFRQLDNPERSRDKGSGLGLAIVDRSARLLGVTVTVRSVLGRGSCFAVEVPLA
jgi:PAS domain S-box-containing protein